MTSRRTTTEQAEQKRLKATLVMERYVPWFTALICALASIFLPTEVKNQIERELANSAVTLVAIFIAVVATSMVVSLADSNVPGMKEVKTKQDVFRNYVNYHTESILVGSLSCILSFIAILVAKTPLNILHQIFFVVWLFTVAASFTLFLRVVFFLRRILIYLNQD
jgi:hypothetical protein